MAPAAANIRQVYWIIVADESQAIFYNRKTRRGPLHEQFTLDNPEGRKRAGEILSDSGGRSFDSMGKGRHTMAREKSGPKTHIAEKFAKQIAQRIGQLDHDGVSSGYALIATPRFLGLLRNALAVNYNVAPDMTIAKELVGHSAAELREYLDND